MMRLIDADALVEKAYWHGEHPSVDDLFAEGVDAVDVSDIDNAPTIEAEPVRHGYWMCGDYYDVGDVCSECDWDSGMVNPTLRYCPNCGAKMDLEVLMKYHS